MVTEHICMMRQRSLLGHICSSTTFSVSSSSEGTLLDQRQSMHAHCRMLSKKMTSQKGSRWSTPQPARQLCLISYGVCGCNRAPAHIHGMSHLVLYGHYVSASMVFFMVSFSCDVISWFCRSISRATVCNNK